MLGSAQHVSVLFFVVSIFGIGISLGVYSILRHVSLYAGFLVTLLVMTVSIFLLSTESLFAFSLGMVFHIFGITAMEVILNLYVMQRVPRGQLSQFEPWRMIAAVAALSIGPWLGVYLQTSYGAWVPFVVALFGSLMTLIYFKGLGLHHLDIRRHPVGSNLIRNIKRFLEQPRLRLAWDSYPRKIGMVAAIHHLYPDICGAHGARRTLGISDCLHRLSLDLDRSVLGLDRATLFAALVDAYRICNDQSCHHRCLCLRRVSLTRSYSADTGSPWRNNAGWIWPRTVFAGGSRANAPKWLGFIKRTGIQPTWRYRESLQYC